MKRARAAVARRVQGEDGSALILVLLIVLFASVVMASVLDFTRAGLTIAPKARDLRNQDSYLQGAVDGAINSIRSSPTVGRKGGPACPTFAPNPPDGSVLGAAGKAFAVSCTAMTVTGVVPVPDQPEFALLTLGTDGITVDGNKDHLLVDGNVYSHGVVSATSKTGIDVNGSLYASGACTGAITSTDPLFDPATSCRHARPAGSTYGDDPTYISAVPNASPLTSLIGTGADPVPTCTSGRVQFAPGYYSETPSALAGSCTGTYRFSPGVYYFNYSGAWDVGTAVAGTVDSSGTDCDDTKPGVQFLFGGDARVDDRGGNLTICAPLASQGLAGQPQRIAVYGLSANANNNTSVPTLQSPKLVATANPSGPTSPGILPFANARLIGETPVPLNAVAVPPLTRNQVATLSYPSFTSVPVGAKIISLTARIVANVVGPRSSLTLTPKSGSSTGAPVTVGPNCSGGCLVDLLATNPFSGGADWRTLNALSLDLTARAGGNNGDTAAVTVDGVELQVSYTAPALEALRCTSSCNFFLGDKFSNVRVAGTVYTPSASWSLDFHNKQSTSFERGMVVRSLAVTVSASDKQFSAPVQLPGTVGSRLVLFRGSVDGQELLRACVLYTDGTSVQGFNGIRAGLQVTVRRWSLMHSPSAENPDCH